MRIKFQQSTRLCFAWAIFGHRDGLGQPVRVSGRRDLATTCPSHCTIMAARFWERRTKSAVVDLTQRRRRSMAVSPNDPHRSLSPAEPEDGLRQRARLDNELQADPEMAEGPASGSRIGLYAIAVVAVLGVVFYGLNSSNTTPKTNTADQTSTSTPATPAASPPPANNQAAAPTSPPGQTTGSAGSSPSATPSTAPAANEPAPPVSAPQAAPTGQDAVQPGAPGPSTNGTSNSNQ